MVEVARCSKDEMFPGRQVSLESAKSVQSFCYLVLVTAYTKLGMAISDGVECRVVQGLQAQLCYYVGIWKLHENSSCLINFL